MSSNMDSLKKKGPKLLVLCFDGATFNLIRPWAREGKLPTFKQIMEKGVTRVLESTVPPISATAWVTFLTGNNPGNHGIFEFRVMDSNTYMGLTEDIVTSNSIRGNTFLDYVSAHGLKICSVSIPITYPPWEINGMMVSGTPTPDNSKAFTYPGHLDFGVMTPYSHQKMRLTVEQKRRHAEYEARKRTQILCDALESDAYDLYLLHLHTADAAHHNYWRFFDPECPAYSPREDYGMYMLESYQVLDSNLKKVLALVDDETPVLVLSDHGGRRRPRRQLNLDKWLKEKGFIVFKKSAAKASMNSAVVHLYEKLKKHLPTEKLKRHLKKNPSIRKKYFSIKKNIAGIDWHRTRAYRIELHHPFVGIEINLKGRQPEGCVEGPDEYENTIEELIGGLPGIRDPENGERIVEKVFRKEDLYRGRNLGKAPDLIVQLSPGFDVSGDDNRLLVSSTPVEKFVEKSGYHDMDGIFIARGPQFKKGKSLERGSLIDITATIIHLLGLPVPEDMDSRVMLDVFEDDYIESSKIAFGERLQAHVKTEEVSTDDEESMKNQLRSLGYLE